MWLHRPGLRDDPTTGHLPRLRPTSLYGTPRHTDLRVVRRSHLLPSVQRRRHVGDGEDGQYREIRMSNLLWQMIPMFKTDQGVLYCIRP